MAVGAHPPVDGGAEARDLERLVDVRVLPASPRRLPPQAQVPPAREVRDEGGLLDEGAHVPQRVVARTHGRVQHHLGPGSIGQAKGQRHGVQEAVSSPEPALEDVLPHVREAPADLVAAQHLHVGQAPPVLPLHHPALALRALLGGGQPQVALLTNSQAVGPLAGDLREVQEQLHGLPDQLELFPVVELQPERSGGPGGGEGTQVRAGLDEQRTEPGP